MLDFSFSWLPFVVVAVANFFVSWLYYSPAVPWFKAWQIGVGMDPNKRQMTEADRKAMPRLMGGLQSLPSCIPTGCRSSSTALRRLTSVPVRWLDWSSGSPSW